MLSCWLVQTVVMLIEASNPPKLRISKTKVTGLIVVLCGYASYALASGNVPQLTSPRSPRYLAWFAMSMGGFFEDVRVRDVVLSIGGQRFTINNVVFGNQRLATCGVFVCKYLFHAITSPGTFISFSARIKLNGCEWGWGWGGGGHGVARGGDNPDVPRFRRRITIPTRRPGGVRGVSPRQPGRGPLPPQKSESKSLFVSAFLRERGVRGDSPRQPPCDPLIPQ